MDEAMAYATLKKNVIGRNGIVKVYNDEKECVYKYFYEDGGYMAEGGMSDEVYYVNDFYPNYDEDKIAKVFVFFYEFYAKYLVNIAKFSIKLFFSFVKFCENTFSPVKISRNFPSY